MKWNAGWQGRFVGALLGILSGAALSNCLFHHDLVFQIEPGFTETEEKLIHEAADRWNQYTYEEKKITFASYGHGWYTIRLGTPPNPQWQAFTRDGDITIIPDLEDTRFLTTVTHEFGHAIGIPNTHIPDGTGLMDQYGSVDHLTPSDYAECEHVHACP